MLLTTMKIRNLDESLIPSPFTLTFTLNLTLTWCLSARSATLAVFFKRDRGPTLVFAYLSHKRFLSWCRKINYWPLSLSNYGFLPKQRDCRPSPWISGAIWAVGMIFNIAHSINTLTAL